MMSSNDWSERPVLRAPRAIAFAARPRAPTAVRHTHENATVFVLWAGATVALEVRGCALRM